MRSNSARLSRFLYWTFMIGMTALPLLTAVYFLKLDWMLKHWQTVSILPDAIESFLPLRGPVTITTKLLSLAVVAIPTALTCTMLRRLALLFSGYARGEIFTAKSVRLIRQVGILLLIREAIAPFGCAALAMALTVNNPPGYHYVAVSLSGSNLTGVVTGLALIVAAGVMERGRMLHEESLLTI